MLWFFGSVTIASSAASVAEAAAKMNLSQSHKFNGKFDVDAAVAIVRSNRDSQLLR